ncbi:hypothetical protein C7974DRAFT_448272 [Boeremia exigua]|uniref:uncharacterized protein n=1 Tax=Boeremia exigua TaxID=749465 RepID=UPI001E8E027B|nr:uncharacterized protein C7974DRAFT_448272 [Boeremia exigua]KAH6643192.1 hypothetical protein C7974DRAFT_448272 [Boeremia exigua]
MQKTCNHPVFPSLRQKLTAARMLDCPKCVVRQHVAGIVEIQAALERRGGIFASRAKAMAGDDLSGRQERAVHRSLTRRWRLAKIDLHRDLELLRRLRGEGDDERRWGLQLGLAFALWREVEGECSRIPGYKYLGDDEQPVEAVRSGVEGVNEAQGPGITPRPTDRPHSTPPRSRWDTTTRDDLPRRADTDGSSNTLNPPPSPPPSPPGATQPAPSTPPPPPPPPPALQRPPPPSSLKRRRTSPSPPPPSKTARHDERVTFINTASSLADPSDSPPAYPSYKRAHRWYTSAEFARDQSAYDRGSGAYRPGTWAVEDDEEEGEESEEESDREEADEGA